MRLHAGASSAAVQDSRGGRGGRGRAPKLALVFGFALLSSLVLGVTLASAVVPTVSVEEASSVGFTDAHVEGMIDPQGLATGYRFEYATQEDFSDAAVGAEGTVEGAAQPVEGDLTGLAPNTTYHLRLVAENGDGPSEAVAADVFTTKEVTPPVVSIESAGAVTATAAHLSGHVTPGGSDPAFITSWRFECSPECPGLVGGEINPADEASHEVEADATGLEPNTSHTVTLYASNLGGEASAEVSFSTAAIAPSDIQTLAVHGPVADTSARLVGAVNSNNSPASYWFEYGPADCASHPCTSVPASHDGVVASASQVQVIGQNITGLQAETTYHYRFVVEGSLGGQQVGADQTFTTAASTPVPPSSCPNEAIRDQQGSTALSDCRALEMVSPADKGLNQISLASPLSPDGNHVLYVVEGPVPGTSSGAKNPLLATRTDAGWRSKSILPSASQLLGRTYIASAATPGFSEFIASSFEGLGNSTSPGINLVNLDGMGGQSLLRPFPVAFGSSGINVIASDDLAHVIVAVPRVIDPDLPGYEPGDASSPTNLFEFGDGAATLVSAMPGADQPPECGVPVPPDGGYGFPVGGFGIESEHWVSSDGRRVFFGTQGDDAGSGCSGPLQLYARDLLAAETILISGPPLAGDPDNGVDRFLQATPDGSQAFFRTATSLDPADDVDGHNSDLDIYRWSAASGQVECLTCAVPNANVLAQDGGDNHAAISEDGSHVYFDSNAAYAGAPSPGGGEFTNTYVWSDGTIRFVAPTNGVTTTTNKNGYLTPDGKTLLFTSAYSGLDSLSGRESGGFSQLYRYANQSASITCVSCPAQGPATKGLATSLAAGIFPIMSHVRAATDDGSTVFFNTAESLVPDDTNKSGDIYEWHDGRQSLITDGTSIRPKGFNPTIVSVSSDGRDLLYMDSIRSTADSNDDMKKLFDARVDGGFLAPPEPAASCQEATCFPAPTAPFGALPGGSDTAIDPGNLAEKHKRKHHKKKHRHRRSHPKHPAGANRGDLK